jgi:hypothetical protein
MDNYVKKKEHNFVQTNSFTCHTLIMTQTHKK